jgi:hypothetical protein
MLSACQGGQAKTAENGAFYTTYGALHTTGMSPILSSLLGPCDRRSNRAALHAGRRQTFHDRASPTVPEAGRITDAPLAPRLSELGGQIATEGKPSNLRAAQGVELVARGPQEAKRRSILTPTGGHELLQVVTRLLLLLVGVRFLIPFGVSHAAVVQSIE